MSNPSDRPGPREKGSAGPGRKPFEFDAGVGQDVIPARVSEREGEGSVVHEVSEHVKDGRHSANAYGYEVAGDVR